MVSRKLTMCSQVKRRSRAYPGSDYPQMSCREHSTYPCRDEHQRANFPEPSDYSPRSQDGCQKTCQKSCPQQICTFKGALPCVTEARCIPGDDCVSVSPPKAEEEIVVFRKRYTCKMRDHTKDCDKNCPSYVRTVAYIVEPHWEQVLVTDCSELEQIIQDQDVKEVPKTSDLGRSLQNAYPGCRLIEQEGVPCQN